MKVAIIHDWLTNMGGAEKVVAVIHNLFPDAPIYTSIYKPDALPDKFREIDVRTSYLQRFPWSGIKYQWLLQFMPQAFESFDLREYELVISSSTSCAKGVLTRADCCHICYCNTPMRYAWDFYHEYLEEKPWWLRAYIARRLHDIRIWDRISADRVDYFIANSQNVARRIRKHYRRQADVIYPPVDTDYFVPGDSSEPGEYFLCAGRLVGYKRVDLAVQAFNRLGIKLVVAGDGPEYKTLRDIAGRSIEFVGRVSDDELRELYQHCRAFLFPGEEDFGLTPLEAQACGKPVIALARGGALETVIDMRTGLFFKEQSVESLIYAVKRFEDMAEKFDTSEIRKHAESFGIERFEKQFYNFVNEKYVEFQKQHDIRGRE